MDSSASSISPDHYSGKGKSKDLVIYSLCILFNSLSFISVLLRVFTRRCILNIFGADDATIIIAEVLTSGVTITTFVCAAIGKLGTHREISAIRQATVTSNGIFASFLLYQAAQTFIKISILIQIQRLFTGKITQKLCTIGLAIVAVMGVAQEIMTAFSCSPLKMGLPPWQKKCIPFLTVMNSTSGMSITTVFLILCIPIAPVLKLQIQIRYKISLLAVFCLGIFACVISIVRLHEFHETFRSSNPSWSAIPTEYWSIIELNVGVLCACLPTIRPLLKKLMPSIFGPLYPRKTTPCPGGGTSPSPYRLSAVWTGPRKRDYHENGLCIHDQAYISSTTQLQSGDRGFVIPQVHLRIERVDVPGVYEDRL